MTIDISLDEGAITNLIGKLNPNRFQELLEEYVDVLSIEGAGVASRAYGSMAGAIGVRDSEGQGTASAHIETIAGNEDLAWIAEFGAGDALNSAGFPVGVLSFTFGLSAPKHKTEKSKIISKEVNFFIL